MQKRARSPFSEDMSSPKRAASEDASSEAESKPSLRPQEPVDEALLKAGTDLDLERMDTDDQLVSDELTIHEKFQMIASESARLAPCLLVFWVFWLLISMHPALFACLARRASSHDCTHGPRLTTRLTLQDFRKQPLNHGDSWCLIDRKVRTAHDYSTRSA